MVFACKRTRSPLCRTCLLMQECCCHGKRAFASFLWILRVGVRRHVEMRAKRFMSTQETLEPLIPCRNAQTILDTYFESAKANRKRVQKVCGAAHQAGEGFFGDPLLQQLERRGQLGGQHAQSEGQQHQRQLAHRRQPHHAPQLRVCLPDPHLTLLSLPLAMRLPLLCAQPIRDPLAWPQTAQEASAGQTDIGVYPQQV